MRVVAVIPARWAATRLPGKPLAEIAGRAMIQHVWERVARCRSVDQVLVATDDRRIEEAVLGFGGKVRMTSPEHRSGTDRVEEAVRGLDADLVVNVQGDEPLIDPEAIAQAIAVLLAADDSVGVGTLAFPIASSVDLADPNLVKVVVDGRGRALYFSRAPIPFHRASAGGLARAGLHRGHVGIYAFRRAVLERFVSLPPGVLEQAEGLEQLRLLEHGIGIAVGQTERRTVGVDTAEDLERVRTELG